MICTASPCHSCFFPSALIIWLCHEISLSLLFLAIRQFRPLARKSGNPNSVAGFANRIIGWITLIVFSQFFYTESYHFFHWQSTYYGIIFTPSLPYGYGPLKKVYGFSGSLGNQSPGGREPENSYEPVRKTFLYLANGIWRQPRSSADASTSHQNLITRGASVNE